MTTSLKQTYEGRQLVSLVKTLTPDQMGQTFGVQSEKFEGFTVVEADIVKAVPANLLGIINAASVRLGLVSADEQALLIDVS